MIAWIVSLLNDFLLFRWPSCYSSQQRLLQQQQYRCLCKLVIGWLKSVWQSWWCPW